MRTVYLLINPETKVKFGRRLALFCLGTDIAIRPAGRDHPARCLTSSNGSTEYPTHSNDY